MKKNNFYLFLKDTFFSFKRHTYYIPAIAVSILSSLGSIAVFLFLFFIAYLIHKKMKKWFPTEKDRKNEVNNLNKDNTPDEKIETEFEKEEFQKKNGINQNAPKVDTGMLDPNASNLKPNVPNLNMNVSNPNVNNSNPNANVFNSNLDKKTSQNDDILQKKNDFNNQNLNNGHHDNELISLNQFNKNLSPSMQLPSEQGNEQFSQIDNENIPLNAMGQQSNNTIDQQLNFLKNYEPNGRPMSTEQVLQKNTLKQNNNKTVSQSRRRKKQNYLTNLKNRNNMNSEFLDLNKNNAAKQKRKRGTFIGGL